MIINTNNNKTERKKEKRKKSTSEFPIGYLHIFHYTHSIIEEQYNIYTILQ